MKFRTRLMTAAVAISAISAMAAMSVFARSSSDITVLEQCWYWITTH